MTARGVADALAGAARRRGADPRVRRGRPARRCSRGEVHYARDAFEGLSLMDRVMTAKRGGAPVVDPAREAALAAAPGAPGAAARHGRATTCPSLDDASVRSDVGDRRRRCPTRAVLRHPGGQGHPAGRLRGAARRAGHVPRASGGCAAPGAAAARPTRSWSRPRAGRGCATGWTGSPPTRCSRRPSCTATSRRTPRATTWSCWTRTGTPSGPGSPSRGSGASGGCAWRTSSARGAATRLGRGRAAAGHRRAADQRVHGEAVRRATTYRDYLEVHGLSVQLTEALAEYWHRRMRAELVLPDGRPVADDGPGGPGRPAAHRLPRLPVLVRLPGLPGPGGPGEDRGPAGRRSGSAWSCREEFQLVPGAGHRRDRRPPPGGQLLQRQVRTGPGVPGPDLHETHS